ncbi:hypothetical protein ABIB39_002834 [Mucilaginibacter sp. UYP27]
MNRAGMTGVRSENDGGHFLTGVSGSSSRSIRIAGVHRSSFCPLFCAQKNAAKKSMASNMLQPIRK